MSDPDPDPAPELVVIEPEAPAPEVPAPEVPAPEAPAPGPLGPPISAFPSTNSIPPACFYNRQGLANWLNLNSDYKQYFINYPNVFPYLYKDSTIRDFIDYYTSQQNTSSGSTILSSMYTAYNIRNVPLAAQVITLSQYQSLKYDEQIKKFRQVYTYNSNAYMGAINMNTAPIYYSFSSYKEMLEFKDGVRIINKLYPFDAMANGTNQYGSTLGWVIPFPL
jgi:hypothetical protein